MTVEFISALQTGVALAITYAGAEILKWIKTRKTRNEFAEKVDEIKTGIDLNKDSIHGILSELKTIKAEVTFNGGASLKDTVYALKWECDARFLAQLNLSPVPTYVCDGSGKCIMANAALLKIFGLSYDLMLGYGWLKAIGKNQEERDEVHHEWSYAVKNGIPYDVEYNVVNQHNGHIKRYKTTANAHVLPSGDVLHYLGTLEEVTK